MSLFFSFPLPSCLIIEIPFSLLAESPPKSPESRSMRDACWGPRPKKTAGKKKSLRNKPESPPSRASDETSAAETVVERERTESIVWRPALLQVPSLQNIILEQLAKRPEALSVDALDKMSDSLATALLKNIMIRQALNTRVAMTFIASRHDELSEALSELDLMAGLDRVGPGYLPSR